MTILSKFIELQIIRIMKNFGDEWGAQRLNLLDIDEGQSHGIIFMKEISNKDGC